MTELSLKNGLSKLGINPNQLVSYTETNNESYGIELLIDGEYMEGLYFLNSPFTQLSQLTYRTIHIKPVIKNLYVFNMLGDNDRFIKDLIKLTKTEKSISIGTLSSSVTRRLFFKDLSKEKIVELQYCGSPIYFKLYEEIYENIRTIDLLISTSTFGGINYGCVVRKILSLNNDCIDICN